MNIHDQVGISWLLNHLGLTLDTPSFTPRYNIAPSATLWMAVANAAHHQLLETHWGLIPSWAKPGKFQRPLTNARAETIWEKASFKHLIANHRCIIPANGFYEWQREGKQKTPYYIHPTEQPAFAFAGIYQNIQAGNSQCCVVTTAANTTMQSIHHRMPVILEPDQYDDWLHTNDPTALNQLMQPREDLPITTLAVSSYVNHAGHEGSGCMQATHIDQPSLF